MPYLRVMIVVSARFVDYSVSTKIQVVGVCNTHLFHLYHDVVVGSDTIK